MTKPLPSLAKLSKPNITQKTILLIAIARCFIYSITSVYNITNDSSGYINFSFEAFFQLDFSNGRTPIYPIIIRICYVLFTDQFFLHGVVALQIIASFISVIYFCKACKLLFESEKFACFITVLYALCPAITAWDKCILTESFALSGTVVFIYYIIAYIKNPKFSYGFINILLALFLTFLRPTSLIIVALLTGFWVLRMLFNKEEIPLARKLLLCSCGTILVILGYGAIFMQAHGYFSISDPMPRQLLIVSIDRGYYKESENQEFIDVIDEALADSDNDTWTAMGAAYYTFGAVECMDIAKRYIMTHLGTYTIDTTMLMYELAWADFSGEGYYQNILTDFNTSYYKTIKILEHLFTIFNALHIYLLTLVQFIFLIVNWIRSKKLPWINLGLFIFMLLILLSTLIAGCGEYLRTMICILPFAYLSFAILLKELANALQKSNN
ncbi:MAG: hypothetical protein R3Y06_09315 [Faecalibacterium sp.]